MSVILDRLPSAHTSEVDIGASSLLAPPNHMLFMKHEQSMRLSYNGSELCLQISDRLHNAANPQCIPITLT